MEEVDEGEDEPVEDDDGEEEEENEESEEEEKEDESAPCWMTKESIVELFV